MKNNAPDRIKILARATVGVTVAAFAFFSRLAYPAGSWALETRPDGAIRVTDGAGTASCQNPVFSPDSRYLLFTRFQNGYNLGPSELVRVKVDGSELKVIIPAADSDNVCVPYGSWVDGSITWASDRAGGAEEIYIANDDGTGIQQVTDHPESQGSYLEPVFNPANVNKIIFEFSPPNEAQPHHVKLLELDQGGLITDLTGDPGYDDRLPSWSKDGRKILFQRARAGQDDWRICLAPITLEPVAALGVIRSISDGSSHDTDDSWADHDHYVLSSSDHGSIPVPNIYAFAVSGNGPPVRVTTSLTNEDGAPSYSPDGKWVAFESHEGQDEDTPSEIWIIAPPVLTKPAIAGGDYRGDGTDDIAIYRPSTSLWSIRNTTRCYLGTEGDVPACGDYRGDGTSGIAVFRESSGLWAIRDLTGFYLGEAGDIPVPHDYDGDGTCEAGIFRGDSGLWAIAGVTRIYFGTLGDAPVAGDYDGDGAAEVGIWRAGSGLWALRGLSRFYLGSLHDALVPGDYQGGGKPAAAIFRSSAGLWAIRAVTRTYFGSSSDQAVPADYDGDSSDEIAVFRASSGLWAVKGATSTYFGARGDIPVAR